MKIKRPLKNVSDISRGETARHRDRAPLVREYQQKAIDASAERARQRFTDETDGYKVEHAEHYPTLALAHAPVAEDKPLGLPLVGEPFCIPIGDKSYIAAEITEAVAQQMVAEASALQDKVLTPEQIDVMVKNLIETGAFWKRHEAKDRARREAASDPVTANAAGVAYSGPAKPDKGKQDGSCNRTACQMPLAGGRQYFMRDPMTTGGRLHYCGKCADDFTKWDRIDSPGQPYRCTELTSENRA